jgi:putative addiction module antidote
MPPGTRAALTAEPMNGYNFVVTMEAPLMELRIRRVGNSFGVILPKEALEALGVEGKAGAKLALSKLPDGRGLELRHMDEAFEKKLALLRDTMKRYKNTLRALAK